MEPYKLIERRRYDRKAQSDGHGSAEPASVAPLGAASMALHLRAPYLEFEQQIRQAAPPGGVVLDVGAGTGVYSFVAAGEGRTLIGVDFSLSSLAQAHSRSRASGEPLALICADAERLPIASGSVDVLTTAGVLYCLDFPSFVREVQRVLRPGGSWVFVDSLDHNPVYRVNRLIGYLRGTRTRRVLTHIPRQSNVDYLRREFRHVRVSYYGIFSFLGPALNRLIGVEGAARWLDRLDRSARGLRRFAFKIVVVASEPIATEQRSATSPREIDRAVAHSQ
jgi:SAM-dependent methyltransferase